MTTETLIQFLLLFAMSIVFSAISLNRESFISFLLAGLFWFATGLGAYVVSTSLLQTVLAYSFVGLGVIFSLAALKVLGDTIMDAKNARFKVGL